ncbi:MULTISPECIES: hypothetical protein [unclassified Beijerinckia]|uniref:hypothetical protein n=1 Tax=unclassified Beijerinckia TaxID=2638183 RepID=UPI00089D336C|nr:MULTISPECIES: hypothetical protein [unclassified Beijerinckia]MDH7799150.1 hypothetical protein [Beijerinckia sp. GAS462]SED93576.1 hypothetical protein SAMN05443249_5969 [Beijerinckia sp. 28-YEA-48]
MTRDDLEHLYATLCKRLADAGEENTNAVLARLTMLLLQDMTDVARATAFIDKAAAGYAAAQEQQEPKHDA